MNRYMFTIMTGVMMAALPAWADDAAPPQIQALTLEGAPIASKHFQSGDNDFRERHTLAIAKVETRDYGNWGLYVLTPNSVERTSVGIGYVTDPYVIQFNPNGVGTPRLEITGAIGAVTGYQDYPVPLLAGQGRLVVYEQDRLSVGASMAVMPYIMEDKTRDETKLGIVGTTPFFSLRYAFQ